jgi:hypothetical protein
LPEVVNMHHHGGRAPEGSVRVDRETKWGNPYRAYDASERTEVIAAYERHLDEHPELLDALDELRGADLACWCAPLPCHADVLLRRANK